MFTAICSPIFGIVGCLIPAWLVIKLPQLKKFRNPWLVFVIIIGILLCLEPFADYLIRKQIDRKENFQTQHILNTKMAERKAAGIPPPIIPIYKNNNKIEIDLEIYKR